MRSWSVPALLLAAAVSAAPGAPQPGEPQPRVSLPRASNLESVVRALENAWPGVVAADESAMQPSLQDPLHDVPLDQALAAVSTTFDRACLRRGHTLALQRRYSHPDEDPGLEMEGVRQAATDLYRLVQPFAPRLTGVARVHANRQFIASLTTEQQHAMRTQGLAVAALPEAQRRLILDINAHKCYGEAMREFRRLAECLTQWDRTRLRDRSLPPERLRTVLLQYGSDADLRQGEVGAVPILPPGSNRRLRTARPEVYELPPHTAPLSAALKQVWSFPARRMTLPGLAAALREAGGPALRTPPWARERAFWMASNGGTRGEVLLALCDVWGWELSPEGRGFYLGPPRSAPAKDGVDLYYRLRRRIPPPIMHMLRGDHEVAFARRGRQMDLVFEDAARVGGAEWKEVRVASLTPENQRRLANLAAVQQVITGASNFWRREKPVGWIMNPERAVITLSGELKPGAHPMLWFAAPDETGRWWRWGWVVGTNSIDSP